MPKTRKSNKRNRKTRRGGDCKLHTNTMFGGNKRLNNNLELMGGSNKLVGTELVGGNKHLNGSIYGGSKRRVKRGGYSVGDDEKLDNSLELVGGNKHLNGSIYGGSKKRRKRVKRGGSSVSVGDIFGLNAPITKMFNTAFGTSV